MSNKLEVFNSKSIVKTLENLMIKVTDEECSPDTVNAACNCAARITDILKVHLEVEKITTKRNAIKGK